MANYYNNGDSGDSGCITVLLCIIVYFLASAHGCFDNGSAKEAAPAAQRG